MAKLTDRERKLKALEQSRDSKRKKFGAASVSLGNEKVEQGVVPSPSWMLDLKMGTGGFPFRHMVEVYGANTLGKSSAIVYPTISNVQNMGGIPALIAAEPHFDINWAARLGVDAEMMLLQRPDHVEEAFEMIHDLVYENLVDYIVFDSLGAMGTESEAKEDSKGKKAFGISGVTTSGLNAILPRMWKNNIGMLIINQQRQNTKARMPGMGIDYESPGGEGLHHDAVIRIHLKPGKTRYLDRMDGEEIVAGRELACTFKKNKMAMNPRTARFDFYYIPTSKYGFKLGVDHVKDVLGACKVSGIVHPGGAGWVEHERFGKIHGESGMAKLLLENPKAEVQLREEMLAAMYSEQIKLRKEAEAKAAAAALEPEETEIETETETDEEGENDE